MATEKKTATVKPKAVVAKVEEVKEEVIKEVKADVQAVEKKAAEAKKVVDKKKTEVKKAAAKKTAAVKKTVEKNAVAVKESINIQFAGKTYSDADLVKITKDVWVYDLGYKVTDIKTLEIYVKPEENKAYFVINGTENGSFDI